MLELTLPEPPDEQTLADVALAAHALAYVIIANRRFTDLFEWGQRSVRLSLAAEIQHRLLPGAFTCEGGQFTLAAWLEPAGEIAGDSFDFAMERDTLHLSMTDAMGHDVRASMLATLAVGALRNARRAGVGLAEQARNADASLGHYIDTGGFVTGRSHASTCGRERRRSSMLAIPTLCGYATAASSRSNWSPTRRSGCIPVIEYRVQQLPLQAGDRLMFITDGVLERNASTLNLEALMIEGAECIREKPCSTSSLPCFTQPRGGSKTTQLRCASTGMADRHASGPPTRGRMTDRHRREGRRGQRRDSPFRPSSNRHGSRRVRGDDPSQERRPGRRRMKKQGRWTCPVAPLQLAPEAGPGAPKTSRRCFWSPPPPSPRRRNLAGAITGRTRLRSCSPRAPVVGGPVRAGARLRCRLGRAPRRCPRRRGRRRRARRGVVAAPQPSGRQSLE